MKSCGGWRMGQVVDTTLGTSQSMTLPVSLLPRIKRTYLVGCLEAALRRTPFLFVATSVSVKNCLSANLTSFFGPYHLWAFVRWS